MAAGASLLDAPVLEHALLQVRPGIEDEFEDAMRDALPIIAAQAGFRGACVTRGMESPGTYLLLVGWDTVDAHEVGFRGSADYQRWRALLHRFYDPFPVVEHFVSPEAPLRTGE